VKAKVLDVLEMRGVEKARKKSFKLFTNSISSSIANARSASEYEDIRRGLRDLLLQYEEQLSKFPSKRVLPQYVSGSAASKESLLGTLVEHESLQLVVVFLRQSLDKLNQEKLAVATDDLIESRLRILQGIEQNFTGMNARSILEIFLTHKGELNMSHSKLSTASFVLEGIRGGLCLEPRDLKDVKIKLSDGKVHSKHPSKYRLTVTLKGWDR